MKSIFELIEELVEDTNNLQKSVAVLELPELASCGQGKEIGPIYCSAHHRMTDPTLPPVRNPVPVKRYAGGPVGGVTAEIGGWDPAFSGLAPGPTATSMALGSPPR
jgi:hypothetical protein